MRLFTAIDISDEVLANLESLIERLRPAARIKWSPPENLHITTKFIGEWPEEQLDELTAILRGLPPRVPLRVRISGLGWFPNPKSPRVFWAGIHAPGLAELARDTEQALAVLDIPEEKRPFSPHLTLARIKDPVPLAALQQVIAALPSVEFGQFTTGRFYLYRSRLTPSGSVYTRIGEFEFPQ